jgi:hypothetical protein
MPIDVPQEILDRWTRVEMPAMERVDVPVEAVPAGVARRADEPAVEPVDLGIHLVPRSDPVDGLRRLGPEGLLKRSARSWCHVAPGDGKTVGFQNRDDPHLAVLALRDGSFQPPGGYKVRPVPCD